MESSALGFFLLFCRRAVDINLRCGTALTLVVLTVTGLTAHVDGGAGNAGAAGHSVSGSGHKALTAGFSRLLGLFSSDGDISLAAGLSFVVDTAHR